MLCLQDFLGSNHFENILELKAELIRLKKKGVIFFAEHICELEMNKEFSLYAASGESKFDNKNAFPIPKHTYFHLKTLKLPYSEVIDYYCDYYQTDTFPPEEFFNNIKEYIANDYVWLYS